MEADTREQAVVPVEGSRELTHPFMATVALPERAVERRQPLHQQRPGIVCLSGTLILLQASELRGAVNVGSRHRSIL